MVDAAAASAAPSGSRSVASSLREKLFTHDVRVIVRLRAGVAGSAAAELPQAIAGAQARIATRLWNRGHSMPGWHAFRAVPAVAMEVDPASLASLSIDPEIESVEEDRLTKPDLGTSVPLVRAPEAWAMGYDGSGVAVAILDTGVDRNHPFFGGRVVQEACFSTVYAPQHATSLCPSGASSQTGTGAAAPCTGVGACFHGTHVAGIAAGYQSASFAGVARAASIIAVQVFTRFDDPSLCGAAGVCVMSYTSDQLRGLDYVLQLRNAYTIASVNMSLGGDVYTSQASCDAANQSTKQAIDSLRAVGIATVIAAGNDGYANAISEPGCISTAISVGNTTNADALFRPSNIASFITLMAPGAAIMSSTPGGGYGSASGTSMSTPHVAGAFAILRQANPGASISDLVAALRSGGRSLTLTTTGSSQNYTYTVPRLDVAGAVAAVCTGCVTPVTGWWWNPNEPGRGFALETRDGRMYLGAFLYDEDGSALWFVSNGAQTGGKFVGTLAKFGLGQTLAGDYRPATQTSTAGTASLTFSSPTKGTLTWAGGSVAIERFPIGSSTVAAPRSGAPETGWWWNPSESGTGWFFETQGSSIFLAGFMYDANGRPIWYVSGGTMLTTGAYDGDLQLYQGGQTIMSPFRSPSGPANAGRISLRFSATGTAMLTLPSGRTVTLSRFSSF